MSEYHGCSLPAVCRGGRERRSRLTRRIAVELPPDRPLLTAEARGVLLEKLALRVRQSGTDRKWDELSRLLQNNAEMFDAHGHRRNVDTRTPIVWLTRHPKVKQRGKIIITRRFKTE